MKTTCKVPFKMMISRRYYFKKPMGKLVSTNIINIKKCCQFGLPCCFFCLRILNCIRGSNIEKNTDDDFPHGCSTIHPSKGVVNYPQNNLRCWLMGVSRIETQFSYNLKLKGTTFILIQKAIYKLKSDIFWFMFPPKIQENLLAHLRSTKMVWYHLDLPASLSTQPKLSCPNPNKFNK